MRLGAAPNLSGSAGSTALNTLSVRWLAFVSSSDATVASSVLCAPQLPWPVPRMVVSSCACGFFPLVVANSMANCGKVEKSSTPGPRRERAASDFRAKCRPLHDARFARRAQCLHRICRGSHVPGRRGARVKSVASQASRSTSRRAHWHCRPALWRPRGAWSVARPARLCASLRGARARAGPERAAESLLCVTCRF